MTVGGTGSRLDQTTGEAAVMREAVNKSATRPVEGPGTDVKQQNATQPVEAPGAGTATQPVEAPGAGMATQPVEAPGAGSEVLPYMCLPVQTVRKNSRVNSGTVPQTSPGMNQLIRNCLKSLPTERLSEA